MDIYRTFQPIAAEYTFFTRTHGTLIREDHMLGYKPSLSKCKKKEITSIFSNHNTMKLEMNHRDKMEKITSSWRLNNMILSNQFFFLKKTDKLLTKVTKKKEISSKQKYK